MRDGEDADHRLPSGLRPGGRFAEWVRRAPAYVVADVDGTLIASGTTASEAVADAVHAAHAGGLRVGFATGRLPIGVQALQRQLEPHGPHIVHNGAQVVADGVPLATWPLARDRARALAEWALATGLYAELFVGDGFFVTDRREAAHETWRRISGAPEGLVEKLDLERAEVIKATVVAFPGDDVRAVLAAIRDLGLAAEAAPSPAVPGASFVNATTPGIDKGSGLAFAADSIGVPLEAVVAVGDGMNDLSMLALAGTALAMGQAPPEVRAAAHLVVPEVDADGVAHALAAAAGRWRA